MEKNAPKEDKRNLIDKGFDLDKRINYTLIAAGLGVAAVGSVIAVPAIVTFGAITAGGSLAGLAVTERLKDGYESMRTKKAAAKLGQQATRESVHLAT